MAGAAPARISSIGLAEVAVVSSGAASPRAGMADMGKAPAVGHRPSIQLTVDGRTPPGQHAASTHSMATGAHTQAQAQVQAASGVGAGRADSGGLEYAPDSRAVMARINRWWKRFDEGVMQPRFGGPASTSPHASSANLQAAGAESSAVHGSSRSFTVPVSRPGG